MKKDIKKKVQQVQNVCKDTNIEQKKIYGTKTLIYTFHYWGAFVQGDFVWGAFVLDPYQCHSTNVLYD
jgi:hypothetical protein